MILSELKEALKSLDQIKFVLPNGTPVPNHFHVTEVGEVNKKFIDCGGVLRNETVVSLQLWEAEDFDHRLAPKKLVDIISLSEKTLNLKDKEIEVEYQSETISKYDLEFDGISFLLTSKFTDCLAKDKCGIPEEKLKVNLSDISKEGACAPGSGCC